MITLLLYGEWGINLKFNIDARSIKFKTWLYFIVFAAVLMIALWIVQIFLLNNFYGTMKTAQTQSVAKEIETSFRHHDSDAFLKNIDKISDSYDMYIYVVSYDGKTTYFSPSIDDYALTPGMRAETDEDGVPQTNSSSAIGMYASEIQALNEEMIQSGHSAYMKFKGLENSQEILAYGSVLSAREKEDLIVYIFSPLWPVSSTIKILTGQLIIVTIVSLILACIISIYLATRFTNPIRKIEHSAKRLAEGEYGIVFRGGHYTELSNLADTLTSASIQLEKSDLIQKDLIANVSHDLRTPLTMIKSYAEMIRDISGNDPEKRDAHLQVIIDETDRLNNLVEDLLAVSRIQSGKMTLEKSTFSLSNAAESILNTYRIKEVEEGYRFNFSCPSDFIVEGDEEKIKQVISNLISNAIKFCGSDKVINISLSRRSRSVRFSVEDHGSGISPTDLDHIWDRYYRSSSNMVRSSEGSGLGLSICKEILTLHKADFGVNSTLGEGTVFWFELNIQK